MQRRNRVVHVNLTYQGGNTLGESQGNVLTKERVERKLQQLENISSPHEAQAQVAVLPLVAVHEARYAVQKFKDQYGVDANSLEILEPIIRNIGWVESTAYFLDISTQREALRTLYTSMMGPQQFSTILSETDPRGATS
jgi:hypothetical protein